MTERLRLDALREYLRGSLWVLPTASVVAAVLAGALLGVVSLPAESTIGRLLFGGSPEGARAVLQVISGSVITVTSVTFSLTLVALQMAATQYSPRLLRNYLRDRGNQAVLSVFLATFAFSLTVLRTVRSPVPGTDAFVPSLGVSIAVVLALVSVGALVYFIHHITQSIRVETILRALSVDTLAAIRTHLEPATGASDDDGDDVGNVPTTALEIRARRSGYVQAIRHGQLLDFLAQRNWTVRYLVAAGDHVAPGARLAVVWGPGRSSLDHLDDDDRDDLERRTDTSVQFGNERTFQEDPSFGLRQLADIAVRALSPSLNDPTTAVQTLSRMSVLLRALAGRKLGIRVVRGEDGSGTAVLPLPRFADYLDLACGQAAQYGSNDVVVVRALLATLESVGEVCATPIRRQVVAGQVERTLRVATQQLTLEADRSIVREEAERIRRQLGSVEAGAADRIDRDLA